MEEEETEANEWRNEECNFPAKNEVFVATWREMKLCYNHTYQGGFLYPEKFKSLKKIQELWKDNHKPRDCDT